MENVEEVKKKCKRKESRPRRRRGLSSGLVAVSFVKIAIIQPNPKDLTFFRLTLCSNC